MKNNDTNTHPGSHLYMDANQYNRFIFRAHESYMQTRVSSTSKSHVTDLAMESASFFESLIHIMDAYSEEIRTPSVYSYEFLDEVEDNFEEIMDKLNASVSKKRQPKKERKQVKER